MLKIGWLEGAVKLGPACAGENQENQEKQKNQENQENQENQDDLCRSKGCKIKHLLRI